MAKFRVRSGPKGQRIMIVNAPDIVTVKRRFMKNHPRTFLDSVELVKKKKR